MTAYDANAGSRLDPSQLPGLVQSHYGRSVRHYGSTPFPGEWRLYFFFKIISEPEMKKTRRQLSNLAKAASSTIEKGEPFYDVLMHMATMQSAEGPISEPEANNGEPGDGTVGLDSTPKRGPQPHDPSSEFLNWINMVVNDDPEAVAKTISSLSAPLMTMIQKLGQDPEAKDFIGLSKRAEIADKLKEVLSTKDMGKIGKAVMMLAARLFMGFQDPDKVGDVLGAVSDALEEVKDEPRTLILLLGVLSNTLAGLFNKPEVADSIRKFFGKTPAEAGLTAVKHGLPVVTLYEMLRHASAMVYGSAEASQPVLTSMKDGRERSAAGGGMAADDLFDPVPIQLAFTHSGLAALNLNENVLASFPEVFKEGMAARADMLGDTGPSAPEHWEGALGLKSVHGYFTGGFTVGTQENPALEEHWQSLRDDVAAFNERNGARGQYLRALYKVIFQVFGMEILHVELGQDPYHVNDNKVENPQHRLEHFGFRDGISQPFADMKMRAPLRGGGTPGAKGGWDRLAAGELYLGVEDEDRNVHHQPANPILRNGGTYLVFRKLEQDVTGFRSFLAAQRDSVSEQKKLAARMMGRWQNGTSLVLSPEGEVDYGPDGDRDINDFLYAKDDLDGAKCPVASHVRRSNPRDIGGNDDVRRHRILRRSIGYGGPMLPEGSAGDGRKRGLLFVAANSRIDLQFEVVQSMWLNKSDFVGQAGLNRCPIVGANDGGDADVFQEPDGLAPVSGVPRFVITRGGDYFFAPSLDALKAIAAGDKFKTDTVELPYEGNAYGEVSHPGLFEENRLRRFVFDIAEGRQKAFSVTIPDGSDETILFVGRHGDVREVIDETLDKKTGKARFSIEHYTKTSERITRGAAFLIGTEMGGETEEKRKRLNALLGRAWSLMGKNINLHERINSVSKRLLDRALWRASTGTSIDLVDEIAAQTVYGVICELYGIRGPKWLTELAVALQFSRRHIGEFHPSWLSGLSGGMPEDLGFTTMQLWTTLLFSDVVGNFDQRDDLKLLSAQAGGELMAHLDELFTDARRNSNKKPENLLEAFVALEQEIVCEYGYAPGEYWSDVMVLMIELIGAPMVVIPSQFGSIMDTMMGARVDLKIVLSLLKGEPLYLSKEHKNCQENSQLSGITRLIYEAMRVKSSPPAFLRRATMDCKLPSGVEVAKDQWIAALLPAAHFDPGVFPEPYEFSLYPYVDGPKRDIRDYMIFGVHDGNRECFGRKHLALHLLRDFVEAAARLEGLGKVAGKAGFPRKIAGATVGLKARYLRVGDPV